MQPRTIITKIKAVNASKNTNAFSSLERNNGVKSYIGMESTFVKKGRKKIILCRREGFTKMGHLSWAFKHRSVQGREEGRRVSRQRRGYG